MHWLILVNLILTLHRSEGVEERKENSNLGLQSFKCHFENCDGDSLSSTTVRSQKFTSIMCFRHIGNYSMKVQCPSPNCCYIAHVLNHTDGLLNIIRSCGVWDPVDGCKITCKEAHNFHLWMNPLEVFVKCVTCNEGDSNECNDQYYGELITAINSPLSVTCYQCRKCSNITADTPKVSCPFHQCCFTALVTDQPNEGIFAVRGCILSKEPCFDTCKQIERQHLLAYANGTFNYCMTCNVGDSDECNRSNYNRPKLLTNTAVRCYECRNCNNVLSTTPTVLCSHPKCCYIALLTDYPNEHTFAVRGCVKRTEKCSVTCTSIEDNHLLAHYEGTFSFCVVCGENEGDDCNGNTYNPITLTMKPLNGRSAATNCFSCKNCTDVTMDTTQTTCSSGCCYSKIIQGMSERGCVRYLSGRCDEFCATQIHDFCDSCSDSNCNNRRINNDTQLHIVFKRTSYIHCYKCVDCYSISDELIQTVFCPDGCCVIVWRTTHKESTIMRMCVNLNGMRCQDYCAHTRRVSKSQDPNGVVHYCEECMIDKCNYMEVYQTQFIAKKDPHINCYQCKDCKEGSTSIKTVICITDCCYSAALQVNGETSIVRACAKIRPGRMCHNYCEYVETEFKKENPTGAVKGCTSCQSDKCNTDKSRIITENQIYVENIYSNNSDRLKILGMRKSSSKLRQGKKHVPIRCYKCRNCKKITTDTPVVCCNERCCHATKLEYHNGTIVIERDCVKIVPGRTCNQYCIDVKKEHTAANPVGSVNINCNTCTSEKCNDYDFNAESITSKPTYHPVTCYSCFGCYELNKTVEAIGTIDCPDKCCYSAIWTEAGREMMTRQCAVLGGKSTCTNFCGCLRRRMNPNKHNELRHCSTCCSQKCNSEPFRKPQRVATKEKNCYVCKSCDQISNRTAIVSCLSGCCFSVLKRQNNGRRVTVRRCATLFPGMPCYLYCSHIEKSHRRSNPSGAVIYCNMCTTDKCNSVKLDTDEIGVTNKAPVKCFHCDGCYIITNETKSKQCKTGCCSTVVWTQFNKTFIKRDCIGESETPCSKYCENANRTIMSNDLTGSLHNCDSCKADECNRLKAVYPQSTTLRPFLCYKCTDCDEVKLNTAKHPCYAYCCYIGIIRINENSPYISKRDCAPLYPGQSCTKYGVYAKSKDSNTVDMPVVCTENLCNYVKVVDKVENFNKNKPK